MISKPSFLKQKNMLRVLYALAPVALVSIYYFGWRVALVCAVSILVAFLTEWIMASRRKGKISYACFVTASLYALSLPPLTPIWIVAVGAIIAIIFGKEAFGGFGKNVFNPAVVGRAFVYVCFPVELTSRFVPVFKGFPGGFAQWSFAAVRNAPEYLARANIHIADAITAATPMWVQRDYGYAVSPVNLILGNIGETFERDGMRVLAAGSIGEVCTVVLIIAALYLLITRTAQWRLMISTLAGAVLCNIIMRTFLGIIATPPLLFTLFSGGLVYAAVFMVTDPVSAPKQKLSQWTYGIFIGAMIVFLRSKAIFAGGVGFAILLGNIISPSLDLWLRRIMPGKKKTA
jgi:Na+-transporting NADH:ubiquinone oxidoreductase subunit B